MEHSTALKGLSASAFGSRMMYGRGRHSHQLGNEIGLIVNRHYPIDDRLK